MVDRPVSFYWVPGCANCTRLKGYLTARGVVFDLVNIQADPGALAALQAAGHRASPVIRVGDRWVAGEESVIDAALGLAPAAVSVLSPSAQVLIERAARMLDLSGALALQLPPSHFDDPTPTMADFVAAGRFLADGRPYVPHGTSKSLVHHIARHGQKAWRVLLAANGVYELGFAIDGSGEYSFFGEPEPETPMVRVVGSMRLTASDMRAWLCSDRGESDFRRMLDTHRGPRSMLQYLRIQTIGMLQHTRQLAALIDGLKIAPAGQVMPADLEGLNMPVGLWN